MDYIKTQFGNIHLNDLPLVVPEPMRNKLGYAFIFFIIFIIVLLLVLYFAKKTSKYNPICTDNSIKPTLLMDMVPTAIKTYTINVYNHDTPIYLENIVLTTADGNIMNIDIKRNPFVKITKHCNGLGYMIHFQNGIDIVEIGLISHWDPLKFIQYINIDLYDFDKKVWSYSGGLYNRRENLIKIFKSEAMPQSEKTLLPSKIQSHQKGVINENDIMIVLSENDEDFLSY
jgi:hypothetical protein